MFEEEIDSSPAVADGAIRVARSGHSIAGATSTPTPSRRYGLPRRTHRLSGRRRRARRWVADPRISTSSLRPGRLRSSGFFRNCRLIGCFRLAHLHYPDGNIFIELSTLRDPYWKAGVRRRRRPICRWSTTISGSPRQDARNAATSPSTVFFTISRAFRCSTTWVVWRIFRAGWCAPSGIPLAFPGRPGAYGPGHQASARLGFRTAGAGDLVGHDRPGSYDHAQRSGARVGRVTVVRSTREPPPAGSSMGRSRSARGDGLSPGKPICASPPAVGWNLIPTARFRPSRRCDGAARPGQVVAGPCCFVSGCCPSP